jgi:hypothetical protein
VVLEAEEEEAEEEEEGVGFTLCRGGVAVSVLVEGDSPGAGRGGAGVKE